MKLLTILMLFGIASANAAPHKEARAPAPAPASSLEARGDITICVPDPVAVAECLPYIYDVFTCSCPAPASSPPAGGSWGKRRSLDAPLPHFQCPSAQHTACMLPLASEAKHAGFECLDISSDVDSCGGCVSEGKGQECGAIDFVAGVECRNGACVVLECLAGWVPSENATECVAASDKGKKVFLQGVLKGAERFWGL